MIPHPDDCNWIDPTVRPYSALEMAVLAHCTAAHRALDAAGVPPAPVRDTYASRTLAVAA